MTNQNAESPRKVVVTGAAGGIGQAVVELLRAHGHAVVGIDRAGTSLPETLGDVPLVAADLADHDSAASAVAQAADLLGGIDNFVGTAAQVATLHRAATFPAEAFASDVSANLLSQFWTAQAALPYLSASSDGRLLMFSSIGALDGLPGQASYAASKAGILGLVRTLAAEWAADGIRVNAILPGLVGTPKVLSMPESTRERVLATVALRRLVTVEEIAATVAFLLSPGGGAITGQALRVDAGAGINTTGLHR